MRKIIYFHITENDPVRIDVCNMQVKVLLESQNAVADLSSLADWIYLVWIYSADGRLLKAVKIVKQ